MQGILESIGQLSNEQMQPQQVLDKRILRILPVPMDGYQKNSASHDLRLPVR